ncbi:SEL1 [Musa troglodytarum]|uniref:SEL1 n=1 Tax=Musa troglodytarum TaxID=320322 RepID=A0A9E7IHK4_9LILI|nr:SEL1 [Musa troglodytarum]
MYSGKRDEALILSLSSMTHQHHPRFDRVQCFGPLGAGRAAWQRRRNSTSSDLGTDSDATDGLHQSPLVCKEALLSSKITSNTLFASPPPFMGSLEDVARFAADRIWRTRVAKTPLRPVAWNEETTASSVMDLADLPEASVPLKEVAADCARRWFQDVLKEARAGDVSMQVLVAQMYRSGYGMAKNEKKANVWITKASRYWSAVRKVSDKHPGFALSKVSSCLATAILDFLFCLEDPLLYLSTKFP